MKSRCAGSSLRHEVTQLTSLKAVLALGLLAHRQVLAVFGEKQAKFVFAHGAQHTLSNGLILADSYHCSRYNTNTGRLTTPMFETVIAAVLPRLL